MKFIVKRQLGRRAVFLRNITNREINRFDLRQAQEWILWEQRVE